MTHVMDTRFMAISVYKGGNGDLVLRQEWPSLERGDRFTTIMIGMEDAERLAMNILSVARSARGEG